MWTLRRSRGQALPITRTLPRNQARPAARIPDSNVNANTTQTFDLLIRGCTALTAEPGRPAIENAVIGIRGDRIEFVGSGAQTQALAAHHVINANGHVATPGFVNVHTHAVLAH